MNKFEIALASAAFAMTVAGSGAARAQAFTAVTAACQDAVPNQVVTEFGPSTASCSTSGPYIPDAPLGPVGTFTSFATGSASPGGGGASIGTTWAQAQDSGISYGPFASINLDSYDTFLKPIGLKPDFEIGFGVSRVFSLSPGAGAAEAVFTFTLALTNRVSQEFDVCTLHDSGSCMVSVAADAGDTLNLVWSVANIVAVSGTLEGTIASAFDPATFDILPLQLFDASGNPVYDVVVRGESGFLYPVATAPIPEPETWALMAAALALLGARVKRRRRC